MAEFQAAGFAIGAILLSRSPSAARLIDYHSGPLRLSVSARCNANSTVIAFARLRNAFEARPNTPAPGSARRGNQAAVSGT